MASCGEVLARLLEAYGIDTVFGIPGTHTIELYRGLPQTSIRHVTPRHEQGAGFMADGYARASGRPAACLTVSGPGALNIATAMGQALQDSVPMLVISANNARHQLGLGEGRLHEVDDLQAAMRQCARWVHTLMRPDELPQVLARAFAIFASARPGPVQLIIPQDVITAPADHVAVEVWPLPNRPAPTTAAVQAASELLNSCKRPVVAVGGGAADAADWVRTFVEKIDAPTTLTHNAKGVLPREHPLYVASSPSFEAVRELYRDADVLVGIGTEFSETDYDLLFDGQFTLGAARLIRIDIDSTQLGRHLRPAIAIHADATLALQALLPLCEANKRDGAEHTAAANKALQVHHPVDYQRFLDSILDALPDAYVVGDSTQPAYFAAAQFHPPRPRSFASAATGFGTLGYALPAAAGAKLACPERPVVCLIGDGGLQFTVNELAALVEAQLPVAVVVWNNRSYEMIAMNFRDAGMAPIACDIVAPDFLQLAQAYGCQARQVQNLQVFKSALSDAQSARVPTLIELDESDFLGRG